MKTKLQIIIGLMLVIYCSTVTLAQDVILKDNIFNEPDKWVEVIDKGDYILLKFGNCDTDTAAIFTWKYETVVNAFESSKCKQTSAENIEEAGRIFYEVQKRNILKETNNYRPVAGVMGFESNSVYLIKENFDVSKTYIIDLKEAIRLYNKQKKIVIDKEDDKIDDKQRKSAKKYRQTLSYKNFIVFKKDSIFDTLLDKCRAYDKKHLKKYGIENIESIIDKNLNVKYALYLESLSQAAEKNDSIVKSINTMKNDSSQTKSFTNDLISATNNLHENVKFQLSTISKIKQVKDSVFQVNDFHKMKIDSIKIDITQTFIETMLVYGTIQQNSLLPNNGMGSFQNHVTLRNLYPIGISSNNSIDQNIRKTYLFGIINEERYHVKLHDVLAFYRPELKNYRRDFSPSDTTFTIVKNNQLQKIVLYKPLSTKLFEFKVFSDFIGMDGTSPNGLVQTEFSKEMYLTPYRLLLWENKNKSAYWGWITYVTPNVTLSKFEKNNKYYELKKVNDSSFITTLGLKQNEIFSIGTELNLLMLSVPSLKTNLYIDHGIAFGRTGVVDSTYLLNDSIVFLKEQGVNTFNYKVIVRLAFQTDERYFFELRGNLNHTNLLNENIYQTASLDNVVKEISWRDKTLYGLELFAGYSPTSNTKGKLFFRYRYNGCLAKNIDDGFSQAQVGYSYYFDK
ncbi:MAG: hypothetical protein HOO86_11530 [Bacteroidales bacterium]|nr:hypothetical protein [Bacteroidales bacterium]